MVALPAVALLASCAAPPAYRHPGRLVQRQVPSGRPSTVNCTWRTYAQKVDHFGTSTDTWPQRYCEYSGYWRGAAQSGFSAGAAAPGPVFFYTGNESPVEEYINNTGLMWQLGEQMGALLIFAEHRFEPQSHPSLVGTSQCFAHCTTAQALADYAELLNAVRAAHQAPGAPAVAFGGSYGGMLAGWFRMKYPDVVAGSIAASAPIWGLASALRRESLDFSAQAISRGLSAAGGATDTCRDNIRSAWPLIKEVGRTAGGLRLLGEAAKACGPLNSAAELLDWAQGPWFFLAEGDYPFPSTYITYSVGPGYVPLPAWPMRVACKPLSRDFGVQMVGSAADVRYNLTAGALRLSVDWDQLSGNGDQLTEQQVRDSGVLELVAALAEAAGVWYNVTGDKKCFVNPADGTESAEQRPAPPREPPTAEQPAAGAECAACPPCDNCPPCPVSRCSKLAAQCNYRKPLSLTFSWGGVVCNEDLYLHNNAVQGVGNDIFWPPSRPRNYTVESIVGPRGLRPGCGVGYDAEGLVGAPVTMDAWGEWLQAYYGAPADIAKHRNIVWSNGALDPWSGGGVYPPGGGPTGPLLQNISADGSQVALVIDLGGHHLDLFFSDPADPPSAVQVRQHEARLIRQWCQEAYDQLPATKGGSRGA